MTTTEADVLAAMPTTRVVKTSTEELTCTLTQEEQVLAGRELAGILDSIASEEAEQKAEREQGKARLSELHSQLVDATQRVMRGREKRTVEVCMIADYPAGKMRRIRMDTGEILVERTLTPEEQQTSFIVPGAEGATEPTAGVEPTAPAANGTEPTTPTEEVSIEEPAR